METNAVHIKVLGKLSKKAQKMFKELLEIESKKQNEISLFVDFSGYEIPIEYYFSKIADFKGEILYRGQISLEKVSQQFFMPYQEIPRGHKTICKFRFLEGYIPDIVRDLPEIDDWFSSNTYLEFIGD